MTCWIQCCVILIYAECTYHHNHKRDQNSLDHIFVHFLLAEPFPKYHKSSKYILQQFPDGLKTKLWINYFQKQIRVKNFRFFCSKYESDLSVNTQICISNYIQGYSSLEGNYLKILDRPNLAKNHLSGRLASLRRNSETENEKYFFSLTTHLITEIIFGKI